MTSDPPPAWDGDDVRLLRGYLGDTQTEFANRLGTRQQTVSEWETGASRPRRMARRLLHMLAEDRGYYSAAADAGGTPPVEGTVSAGLAGATVSTPSAEGAPAAPADGQA